MKYIRTKCGIYDFDKSTFHEFTGHKVIMPYCEEYEKQPELCKTSDTIEELCDDFVWDNKLLGKGNVDFETKTTYVSKGGFIPFADWGYEIYGAIWVKLTSDAGGWGLVPVAKMNNKGELELL